MNHIASTANEKVKSVVALAKNAAQRAQAGLFVVEGAKLCAEAALSGVKIRSLWVTEKALQKYGAALSRVCLSAAEVNQVTEPVAVKLSSQKAPQGVVAVCEMPKAVSLGQLGGSRVLALCTVQDPGNLGAAVRSAAAFGFSEIVLSADCADIYSPKVLRAAMGAVFRCRFSVADNMAQAIAKLGETGYQTLAAALAPGAVLAGDIGREQKLLVAIGNEGAGLPPSVINACSRAVMIPIGGGVESLNAAVAAGILMYELRGGQT